MVQARTSFTKDNNGISTVVGAILVVGILLMSIVVTKNTILPTLAERDEQQHSDLVKRQLLELKNTLEKQTATELDSPIDHALSLKPQQQARFLQTPYTTPATLNFEPNGAATIFTYSYYEQHIINSQVVAHNNEIWNTVTPGSVTNVGEITKYKIKLENPEFLLTGTTIEIAFNKNITTHEGRITIVKTDSIDTWRITTTSYDAGNNIIAQDFDLFFIGEPISSLTIDLMQEVYRTQEIFSAATNPADITTTVTPTSPDIKASRTLTIEDANTQHYYRTSNGGITPVFPTVNIGQGLLKYNTYYNNYISQEYHVEGGALILIQDQGAVMASRPGFTVGVVNNHIAVQTTIPTLSGAPQSTSGTTTVKFTTTADSRFHSEGSLATLTWNQTSQYPEVWATFWDEEMQAAGLQISNGDYNITMGADYATLVIYGLIDNSPTSTLPDIYLREYYANINIRTLVGAPIMLRRRPPTKPSEEQHD